MKRKQLAPVVVVSFALVACGGSESAVRNGPEEEAAPQIDVAALVAQLEDSQSGEWSTAIVTLGDAGAVAVPALVEALDSPNDDVRLGALQALARNGPAAEAAVPRLLRLAVEGDDFGMALMTLGTIGPAAREAAPLALERLRGSDSVTERMQSVEVLASVLPVEESTPHLLAALEDEWSGVRSRALFELARLEVVSEEAVTRYIALLADADAEVRRRAARAVAPAAPQSEEAVSRLMAMLAEDDTLAREEAAKALGAIGPPLSTRAKDPLVSCLDHEMYQVRKAAGEALGRIGEDAAEAIPLLTADLESTDKWRMVSAAEGLAAFGPLASGAVPALEGLVDHEDLSVKWGARKALERIRGGAS